MDDIASPAPLESPRLAAIVFTDVVGYSALMQASETGTIGRVEADFQRMRKLCARHGGEVLNTMGDGMMLSFNSAVQAVAFALQIQNEFGRRKATQPGVQWLEHRIGIHLGDVFRLASGHLAGDGVNIAARLESRAPHGGVCISQTVYDIVKGKLPLRASPMGLQSFKNIAEPITVWQLVLDGDEMPLPQAAQATPAQPKPLASKRSLIAGASALLVSVVAGGAWWLQRGGARRPETAAGGAVDARTIAVLPFASMSADNDAGYFADGIHEDLLTQLALLGELKVVSRTSVMEYRNTAKKMRQIGAELGVASLVEGSVRRAGNQVRVTAQLIDAATDKHLWARNYDRELKDIFAVQSELATEIARALRVSLTTPEQERLARKPTDNLQAYDLFLRHQEVVNRTAATVGAIGSVKERVALLAKAVELDPRFALAWARLGAEQARLVGYGIDASAQMRSQARQAVDRALALAPDDLQVKIEEGAFHLHAMNDHQRAVRAYGEVVKVAPYNVAALIGLCEVHMERGQTADAVGGLERALSVDARNAIALNRLSAIYARYHHFDKSLALRRKLVALRPDDLDLQANYHLQQYWSTGSWESYDKWRATLPAGVELKSARVRNTDADRAIARRDFAEVARLTDVETEDLKANADPSDRLAKAALQALLANARGDKPKAVAAARSLVPLMESRLARDSDDYLLWKYLAWNHAMLGQDKAALAAHAKATVQAQSGGNLYLGELVRRDGVQVLALLGHRDKALEMLRDEVKRPGSFIHDRRVSLPLVSLWDDPEFLAIVRDPASVAPLPLTTKIWG